MAKRCRLSKESDLKLLDLPSVIIMDILARLPVDSVIACRCVCKFLFGLISENDFAKLYLENTPFTSIMFTKKTGYYLLELGQFFQKTSRFYLPSHDLIVGSCNGLLCLLKRVRGGLPSHNFSNIIVQICNPIWGQYVTLPRPSACYRMLETYGFGFCPTNNHYKVIRFTTLLKQPWRGGFGIPPLPSYYKSNPQAEVLTVGTDTWRSVGYAPYPLGAQFPGANLNGALHWIVDDDFTGSGVLYSFDIGKEQARPIPCPPDLGKGCRYNLRLGVLQNCLCVFDNSHYEHFYMWSMKDYGLATSWTLDLNLRNPVPVGLDDSMLEPLTFSKDCEILMKRECGDWVSYNQNQRIITKFESNKEELFCGINAHLAHATNFSSLKTIVPGECSKIEIRLRKPRTCNSARSYKYF